LARYLLATTPSAGHVIPTLPLASALVDRGHEVRWYTGAAFAPAIEAAGTIHCPMVEGYDFGGRDIEEAFPELVGLTGIAAMRGWFMRGFIDTAEGALRDCQAILDDFPADVIVANTVFLAARHLHELDGLPWATLGDTMLGTYSSDVPPVGLGLRPMRGPLGQARNRLLTAIHSGVVFGPVTDHLDRARARVGLPPVGVFLDSLISPYLHLQGTVAACEYPRRDLEPQIHFVGPFLPSAPERYDPPWWDELDGDRPVVLVTQGTVNTDASGLLAPAIAALAEEDVLVIATTGAVTERVAAALPQPIPANVRLERFIPLPALLPHVDVVVTNGGYGGTQQTLAHGIPLVIAGATEEKPETAARVAWAGAGIRIRRHPPRPAAIRKAVRAVLDDPRYRTNAERIQADMAACDAAMTAARLLERLAATGETVLRGDVPGAPLAGTISSVDSGAGER
jgi:UDP:flavonoid glycosyltransferase YjiC (YdhE family)